MEDLTLFAFAGAFVAVLIGLIAWTNHHKQARRAEREKRARFISEYRFPGELSRRFREKYPALTMEQAALVLEGLRQYFLACLNAQGNKIARQVGMPSRAVDDAWHEFIVMTRDYEAFCKAAFGSYLHHTPKLQMAERSEDALANTLHQLRSPSPSPAGWAMLGAMPLLFAMDHALGIRDGFHHDTQSLGELDQHRWNLARLAQAQSASVDGGIGSSCDTGSSSCGDSGGGGSCGGG